MIFGISRNCLRLLDAFRSKLKINLSPPPDRRDVRRVISFCQGNYPIPYASSPPASPRACASQLSFQTSGETTQAPGPEALLQRVLKIHEQCPSSFEAGISFDSGNARSAEEPLSPGPNPPCRSHSSRQILLLSRPVGCVFLKAGANDRRTRFIESLSRT
jgi:hypothetical protein